MWEGIPTKKVSNARDRIRVKLRLSRVALILAVRVSPIAHSVLGYTCQAVGHITNGRRFKDTLSPGATEPSSLIAALLGVATVLVSGDMCG